MLKYKRIYTRRHFFSSGNYGLLVTNMYICICTVSQTDIAGSKCVWIISLKHYRDKQT